MFLIGIDVGTTSTRTIAVDPGGRLVASAVEDYPLSHPRPLWSQQDPADWWRATCITLRHVLEQVPAAQIRGIGLTGQMHGLVLLDERDHVLRPAILWNDQRTARECEWITQRVGLARLVQETCNPALTGFTAGKIVWVREHEPEIFRRTRRILLPKDFVRFKLTGQFATDVSDASGTSLLNVPQRTWSRVVLDAIEFAPELLPDVHESTRQTGAVTPEAAKQTGLAAGTPVVGGGGDQAAGAIGVGIVRPGAVCVSLGTSGVVFAFAHRPEVDPHLRTHTFCHAVPGRWHVMGVMLSAGGSLRWLRDALYAREKTEAPARGQDVYDLMTAEAGLAPAGCEGLIFLPYLTGERTPHPDPHARAAFVGLTPRHTRGHLARAVLEGVGLGLRDSLTILRAMHVPVDELRLTGGGARSPLWRQILADVFGQPVRTLALDEGPAFGAALLAGAGTGVFASVEEAADAAVRLSGTTEPQAATQAAYAACGQMYVELYPALKPTFGRAAST